MTRPTNEKKEETRSPWLAVSLAALVALVLLLVLQSVLEVPTGDGVPGPADWAREQSGP